MLRFLGDSLQECRFKEKFLSCEYQEECGVHGRPMYRLVIVMSGKMEVATVQVPPIVNYSRVGFFLSRLDSTIRAPSFLYASPLGRECYCPAEIAAEFVSLSSETTSHETAILFTFERWSSKTRKIAVPDSAGKFHVCDPWKQYVRSGELFHRRTDKDCCRMPSELCWLHTHQM